MTAGAFPNRYDRSCAALPEPGCGKCAGLLCYYLLEQHGVIDALGIPRTELLQWLSLVDAGYKRGNAYHNALHAADVTATVDYFMRQPNLEKHVVPLDRLAALLAATIHDLGHSGVNNTFLETTSDPLAVTYVEITVYIASRREVY